MLKIQFIFDQIEKNYFRSNRHKPLEKNICLSWPSLNDTDLFPQIRLPARFCLEFLYFINPHPRGHCLHWSGTWSNVVWPTIKFLEFNTKTLNILQIECGDFSKPTGFLSNEVWTLQILLFNPPLTAIVYGVIFMCEDCFSFRLVYYTH